MVAITWSRLADVPSPAPNPPTFTQNATDPLSYYRQLTVPSGSKGRYEVAQGWKRCKPIVEIQ